MQRKITRTILIALSLLFFSLGAFAKENILHSIQVSRSFDGYTLTLKTDKLPHSTKRIENQDKIYFDLDNTKIEDGIQTIYKNTGNIDGVVIQQNGNKTRIYLNGKDAKNSQLTFETPTQTIALKNQKETKTNTPSYIFFVLIAGIFLMFNSLLKRVKKESERGYANKLLRQVRPINQTSKRSTVMSSPYTNERTTIKLIERNRELYAASRKTA